MSDQPIEALDFHPIALSRCDRCNQATVARLDTGHGPLFFCRHHVQALFPVARPGLTYAAVTA